MRRRRRRRYFWLPELGRTGIGAAGEDDVYWDLFGVVLNSTGASEIAINDITFDIPKDNTNAGTVVTDPMSDFLRSGYMLRRVVGNVYLSLDVSTSGSGGGSIKAAIVTYGIFVARAGENPIGAFDAPPIGTEAAGAAVVINQKTQYGPQHIDNVREPFLFHRNWVLGNRDVAASIPGFGQAAFPSNNAGYGSAFEGTFIDQKTLRRVDGDNRLYHTLQVRTYPLNAIHNGAASVTGTVALRFLGRPISTAKRGAF